MTSDPLNEDLQRLVEAWLFLAPEPVHERDLAERLPPDVDLPAILARLKADYARRGILLVQAGQTWAFATAPDLAGRLQEVRTSERKLSRAALETLAIIAYHQPVTRSDIESIRGVGVSKGTLDVLIAEGWVAARGHREVPGRPTTWGTTDAFLRHFHLSTLDDLPGADDLAAAGFVGPAPAAAAALALVDGEADGDDDEA